MLPISFGMVPCMPFHIKSLQKKEEGNKFISSPHCSIKEQRKYCELTNKHPYPIMHDESKLATAQEEVQNLTSYRTQATLKLTIFPNETEAQAQAPEFPIDLTSAVAWIEK